MSFTQIYNERGNPVSVNNNFLNEYLQRPGYTTEKPTGMIGVINPDGSGFGTVADNYHFRNQAQQQGQYVTGAQNVQGIINNNMQGNFGSMQTDLMNLINSGQATLGNASPQTASNQGFNVGTFSSNTQNQVNNSIADQLRSFQTQNNTQNQQMYNQFQQSNQSMFDAFQRKLSQQNMANHNRNDFQRGVQGNVGIGQGLSSNRGSDTGFKTGVQQNNLNRFAGNLWGGGR